MRRSTSNATASYMSALISVKLVLSQAPAPHCKTTDTGLSITRCACLLPAFAGYSCCLPTEGWRKLSKHGCLVLRQGGLPVRRRSPIQGSSTNRTWRRVSTLIETNVFPLSQYQACINKNLDLDLVAEVLVNRSAPTYR